MENKGKSRVRFTDSDGVDHGVSSLQDAEQRARAMQESLGERWAVIVGIIDMSAAPPAASPYHYGYAGHSIALLGLADVVHSKLRELVQRATT